VCHSLYYKQETLRFQCCLCPRSLFGLGSSLLVLLVTNRLFTPELLNSQSRADLIATLAPVLIVLKALSDLDITPRQAEPVPLDGSHVEWVEPSLPSPARGELEWAADALMQSESCVAVVIYHEGRTLLQRGTLPTPASAEKEQGEPAVAVKPGPLLTKCMQRVNGAPEYLPALQLLPGRVEFGYLPSLTQGVLMVPLVGSTGALILACNRQRGFNEEDVAWARSIGGKISESLGASL